MHVYGLILDVRQYRRPGCVRTFPAVFTITHAGTPTLDLSARAIRSFLPKGLTRAIRRHCSFEGFFLFCDGLKITIIRTEP